MEQESPWTCRCLSKDFVHKIGTAALSWWNSNPLHSPCTMTKSKSHILSENRQHLEYRRFCSVYTLYWKRIDRLLPVQFITRFGNMPTSHYGGQKVLSNPFEFRPLFGWKWPFPVNLCTSKPSRLTSDHNAVIKRVWFTMLEWFLVFSGWCVLAKTCFKIPLPMLLIILQI